jgi:hypothetical protein
MSAGEQRIGDLVDPALRHLGVRKGVREVQLRDAFAEVVGERMRHLCQAVSLDRGTLCIATVHTGLAHQLQLDSTALIAALNERIGTDAVRRLRFIPRG